MSSRDHVTVLTSGDFQLVTQNALRRRQLVRKGEETPVGVSRAWIIIKLPRVCVRNSIHFIGARVAEMKPPQSLSLFLLSLYNDPRGTHQVCYLNTYCLSHSIEWKLPEGRGSDKIDFYF